MSAPDTVRCRGCGVSNAAHLRSCQSCGTSLRGAPSSVSPDPQTAASPPSDGAGAAELGWAQVRGVARLFLVTLGLGVGAWLAVHAGASQPTVDVVTTVAMAIVVSFCAVAARAQLAPLLSAPEAWRATAATVVGFGVLVTFCAIYFRAGRWLGLPIARMSDSYLEAGWPRWAPYLLIAVAPGFLEELTFRGYVMARLDLLLTPTETLLVQAALFSVLHLGVAIFPSHFVIGLILGAVRRRTGSLYPGMAIHIGWNASVLWGELSGRGFP